MNGLLEIGQAVLAAQGKIFKECAKRHGLRVAFLIVAVVFLGFAAISLHGVFWAFFEQVCHFGPLASAACVLGVDVLLVVIFLLLALRAGHSSFAEERARMERDRKLHELKQGFAFSSLFSIASGPVGRYAGGQAWRIVKGAFARRKK